MDLTNLQHRHIHLSDIPAAPGKDGEFSMYKILSCYRFQSATLAKLRRCAFIVSSIMRRHGWQMPILAELHPEDDCLGKSYFTRRTFRTQGSKKVTLIPREMRLRLRYPEDPAVLLPMKDLIRTVLHELAHFNHRSHFFAFYRFNAELLEELVKDAREGSWMKVRRREIPSHVACSEEIRETMIRDFGKKIASCFVIKRLGA